MPVGLTTIITLAVAALLALARSCVDDASTTSAFSPSSPWNTPISADPKLDPRSAAIASYLASAAHPPVANTGRYGVPIWHADASTPRYDVRCTRPWGTCGLEQEPVPIPDGAHPSAGTDRAMVVVDPAAGKSYEFWQAERVDGTWLAGWGGVVDLAGEGTPGAAVGAGVSRLAGVVRAEEVRRGRIEHALVFSTDNACSVDFRYPASKTDGHSRRADCIPEGARIQLDPAIAVDDVSELTPVERMVARALQVYGAYAVDNGGARMAFIFEVPTDGRDPYGRTGLEWDYFALEGIPWSSLRVLEASETVPR